jgi:hypothetical protein
MPGSVFQVPGHVKLVDKCMGYLNNYSVKAGKGTSPNAALNVPLTIISHT